MSVIGLPSIFALTALHLIGTLGMFGIVFFCHVVQYPMLAKVPEPGRKEFEKEYCSRAGIVIIPLMLIEAVTATALYLEGPDAGSQLAVFGLALLAVIWLVTFSVSGPAHDRLIEKFDPEVHARLLFSNFLRVLAWSGRVVVALVMAGHVR